MLNKKNIPRMMEKKVSSFSNCLKRNIGFGERYIIIEANKTADRILRIAAVFSRGNGRK
jgi:hypothetical protein